MSGFFDNFPERFRTVWIFPDYFKNVRQFQNCSKMKHERVHCVCISVWWGQKISLKQIDLEMYVTTRDVKNKIVYDSKCFTAV